MMTTESFVYKQRTFELNDTAGQLQALHDDGFALIPNVLSADEVATARAAIDRLEPFGFDALGATDHYKCVFNRDVFWLNMLDRAGVVDLAEAAMGKECHIIGQTAWRSHPGHDGWAPHTDRTFVEVPEDLVLEGRVKLPIYLCTAHFYLSDITEELCPTYVIRAAINRVVAWCGAPTRTRHGTVASWSPVLCKAGDVLFFRSEIWHSGSLNKTANETRYFCKTTIHIATSRSSFRLTSPGSSIPKFWLPPMSANCACWENIVLPLMIECCVQQWISLTKHTSRKRTA
jgi:hypothetical protein